MSRQLSRPVEFGIEGQQPVGMIFHRFAATDDVGQLRRGIHIENAFSESPGDTKPMGLYFSAYGDCARAPHIHLYPSEKPGVVKVDVRFDLEKMIDDLLTKGRYALFTLLHIRPANFQIFRGKIREVLEFARGGRNHILSSPRNQYEELLGHCAEINLRGISPDQLIRLGEDVKIMLINRSEQEPLEFKSYKKLLTSLKS